MNVDYFKQLAGIVPGLDAEFQELLEDVEIPADVSLDKLSAMLEAAYRAVSISKRLQNIGEREKYLNIAMQGVTKIIAALKTTAFNR